MYCVNCGVRLADTENLCPLCKTAVYHPDLLREKEIPLYPKGQYPVVGIKSKGLQVFLTLAFLLPMLIVFLCDFQLNRQITWSAYVLGALFSGYVILVLPSWFRNPNPVIFVPCGFAAVGLYLLHINFITQGNWFLSFAFPVLGGVALIVTAVVALLKYLPRGKFFIVGGAFIALGAFMLLVEFLLNLTFRIPTFFGWSLHPLIALALLGGWLIFLGICRPARETMERKFFI